MVSDVSKSNVSEADEIRREIDSLLADIAALSDAGLPPGDFYPALLERAVFAISAVGGQIWLANSNGRLQRIYQVGTDDWQQTVPDLLHRVETGLRDVTRDQQETIVGPPQPGGSPIVGCPIMLGGRPWGVLALWVAPEVPQAAHRGFLKFGAAVAGIAGDFQETWSLAELGALTASRTRFDAFCGSVHGAWSQHDVAFQIANEGRVLLECDRLSVAIFRGRRSRVVAVSGAADIGRGNEQVSRLQHLVNAVAPVGQPFFFSDDTTNLAPQVERTLVSYLDTSNARAIAIIPLIPRTDSDRKEGSQQPVGAIVVEQFTLRPVEEMAPLLLSMSQHAAVAIDRSLRIAQIPLLAPLLRWLQPASRAKPWYLSKWVCGAAAFVLLLAALGIVKTDFNVSVRGELRPVNEQNVFAPVDGIVTDLVTGHGKTVGKGAPLLTLRSTELDLESARIRGELLTAQKRLAAIEAKRLEHFATGDRAEEETNRLSADELSLRERISSLKLEYEILENHLAQLQLVSPISGTVLTWDLKHTLGSRPVRRGQALLSVGDLSGPWMLELHVPDEQIGHIQAALDQNAAPIDIQFVLATQPNKEYAATSREIGTATQIQRPGGGPIVLLTADFDQNLVDDVRPGASVHANVHCGRASYLYVWLHGFYEEISRRLF